MNLVAYLRVSTDAQIDRYGLASQRTDVERWAKAEGHTIARWCVDEGVSGTVEATDRPGLACALEAIESGEAEGVVTPKLDRLARSLSVQEAALAHVWKLGGRFFTAESGEVSSNDSDDPMRTAMRQMAGVFAELERAMIVQRMQKGRAAKASTGGYAYGAPPYGWRSDGGQLVPVESEQMAIWRILQLHAQGVTHQQMTEALAAEGHKPRRSERFASSALHRIIKRAIADPSPS